MFITHQKTGWFHLFLVLVITLGAVYVVREALAKPFVDWETKNQLHQRDINDIITEIEPG